MGNKNLPPQLADLFGIFSFLHVFPWFGGFVTLKGSTKLSRPNGVIRMAKPHRPLKKANHGKRPSNAKARRAKRRLVRT
jgi:hypothetical protein